MAREVLLICGYAFPSEDASANRVYTIAKMLQVLEYDPILIGLDQSGTGEEHGVVNGIRFFNIIASKCLSNRMFKYYYLYKSAIEAIEDKLNERDIKYAMITHIDGFMLRFLLRLSKRRNLSLFGNIVEWYDKSNFVSMTDKFKLILNRWSMIFLNKRMRNIIAISSYLEKYYRKQGCNVVRIPAIIDGDDYIDVDQLYDVYSSKIIFAYAGYPGTKDSVVNFLCGAAELSSDDLERIEIRLFGITAQDMRALGTTQEVMDKLQNHLYCMGRIPHSQVKQEIAKANFSILVRPDRRSSHAGFPTKLAESFACGTPIIANLTSDLDLFLNDMNNSVICKDDSVSECKTAIQRVINLSYIDLLEMKKAAKISSRELDFHYYLAEMFDFLTKAQQFGLEVSE